MKQTRKALEELINTVEKMEDLELASLSIQEGMRLALKLDYYDLFKTLATIGLSKFYSKAHYKKLAAICYITLEGALLHRDFDKAASAYHNLGILYKELGEFDLALKNIQSSIAINKAKNNLKALGNNYSTLGNIYELLGDSILAHDFFTKGIHLCKQTNDKTSLVGLMGNIAALHFNREEYDLARKVYEDAIIEAKKINLIKTLPRLYNGLGLVLIATKKFQLALTPLKEAIIIAEKHTISSSLGHSCNQMGVLHKNLKQYDLALEYFERAIKIRSQSESKESLAETLANIANLQSILGNHQQALQTLNEANHILKDSLKWTNKEALFAIYSEVYSRAGDLKKALQSLHKAYDFSKEQSKQTIKLYHKISRQKEVAFVLPEKLKNDQEEIVRDVHHLELIHFDKIILVPLNDILWVEAYGNYIKIQTAQERLPFRISLKKFCSQIVVGTSIKRIHKSWAVNMDKVSRTTYNHMHVYYQETDKAIPYGRSYKR